MKPETESLSRAIAEQVVKVSMGFTDSKEDKTLWKWQLHTVEVNRWVNRIQGVLDGYEIKPKEGESKVAKKPAMRPRAYTGGRERGGIGDYCPHCGEWIHIDYPQKKYSCPKCQKELSEEWVTK